MRYFLESAKTGSFTKAAEKYTVPPSSVPASIRRLEQELERYFDHYLAMLCLIRRIDKTKLPQQEGL